jgi:hypothetical protein
MLSSLLVLAACTGDSSDPPVKITGLWELHQVETAKGEIAGVDAVLSRYPGCVWGRSTWSFTDDHVEAAIDVLCPASEAKDEMYGCTVTAAVPAAWNATAGSWQIADAAAATSRTLGVGDGAIEVPTSCSVQVAAGDYLVRKVRNQRWKWEMRTPDGTVYRLRQPDSDRPDFVTALRGRDEKGLEGAKVKAAREPSAVEPK